MAQLRLEPQGMTPEGTELYCLNMGPQHPSTHGVLRVILELDGETVVKATPILGYLHRGIEKLAEARTYPQFIPYTDRMDYVSSMCNNLAYCQTVEKLVGVEVPERAEYIRVMMAELNRIDSFPEMREKVRELGFDLLIKRAKIGTSKHIRVRPEFSAGWRISGHISVWDEQITGDALASILEYSGQYKGLCDWRPGGRTPGAADSRQCGRVAADQPGLGVRSDPATGAGARSLSAQARCQFRVVGG